MNRREKREQRKAAEALEAETEAVFMRSLRRYLDSLLGGKEKTPMSELDDIYVAQAAKLDDLTELVEAMATTLAGTASSDGDPLKRLLAWRRGDCEACFGDGHLWRPPETYVMCPACNGTGKAKQGDSDG